MTELKLISLNIRGLRNKCFQIIDLIKRYKPDFILLQETNIDNTRTANAITLALGLKEGFFSFGPTGRVGSGVAIFKCSDIWVVTQSNTDADGRTVFLTITSNNKTYTLINSYTPAVTKHQQKYYETFTQTIDTFHSNYPIIIGGDFNNTQARDGTRTYFKTLQLCLNNYNMTDTFITLYPDSNDTTHSSSTSNSGHRIDRVYAYKDINVIEAKHLNECLNYTDHKGVLAELNMTNTTHETRNKRSPHWKLNNTILDNEIYVNEIRKQINYHKIDIENAATRKEISLLWENLKLNIIDISQRISTQLHRTRKKDQIDIMDSLNMSKLNNTHEQTQLLELELEKIAQEKYKGAQIRTKLYTKIDETPSRQFLTLEQNVQNNRQIKEVKNIHGDTCTNTHDISNAFKEFYQNLYTHERTSKNAQDLFLTYANPLNEEDKNKMEAPFTVNDFKHALSEMNKNKTPGPDGLTVEFYRHFYDDLSPLFVKLIEEIYNTGTLPNSLTLSYITLLPKDNPDKTSLKNYRPISLLNVDYKLISKAITNKLRPIMGKIINEDQQCSVKDRKIQNHLHFIRDFIYYCNYKNTNYAMISLDQEKAFDRIAHDYMFKALAAYNISNYIINWIKILYKSPTAKLLINHTLSDPFLLTRSIRQGCSLSPLLYIICLEPLLQKIRSLDIGIILPGGMNKTLIAYADDTTFLVKSNSEIEMIINTFNHFGEGSGSKINIQKTSVMGLGNWKNKADYPFGLIGKNNMKVYGINFTNTSSATQKQTWDTLLSQIKSSLAYYKRLNTTIFGRAYIVNTVIISKLLYTATILNIPDIYVKEINKNIFSYIFTGTINSIKRTTLAQTRQDGGINVQLIEEKVTALRISYLSDIIKNKDKFPLAHFFFGLRLTHFTKLENNMPHFFGRYIQPFYQSCYQALLTHKELIGKGTKDAYISIKKKIEQPLNTRIKIAYRYGIMDVSPCFKNTHNKFSTITEKEITYRLLFNITPIRPILKLCPFCKLNVLNEEHIFALCNVLQPIRTSLEDTLEQLLSEPVNIHMTILLNIFPKTTTKTWKLIVHLLGAYRYLIWHSYANILHKHIHTPLDRILLIWETKQKCIIKEHINMNLTTN